MLGWSSNVEEKGNTEESPTNSTFPIIEAFTVFSAEDLATISYWQNWDRYLRTLIDLYLAPIILVLGYLGNILTIIIFNKTPLSHLTASIYFKTLAIVDMLVLLTWLNYSFYKQLLPSGDPLHGTVAYCNFLRFGQAYSRHLSGAILSALAVDRMIGVVYPLKYKFLCTKKKCYIVLGALFTILFVFDLIYLLETMSVEVVFGVNRWRSCKFRPFLTKVSVLYHDTRTCLTHRICHTK